MTLKDVREPAATVAAWCHAQEDLAGFKIDPHEGGVRVRIAWRPHGWGEAREFTASEVRTMRRDDVAFALTTMADELRDPVRLPG